jgi:hypothetical protein
MPKKPNRVDNSEWKASSPTSGTGQTWRQWALENPNRKGDAKRTEARMKDAINKGKEKEESTKMLTSKGAPAKPREKKVANWAAKRPVSGKGGATSDAEKEEKRQTMIEWAKSNPNRMDNARLAQGKKPSRQKGGQGRKKK